MIAGGIVLGNQNELTEVIELFMANSIPSFGQLPSTRCSAVGAMFGNAPIICGGSDGSYDGNFFDSCIAFQNSQWSTSHSMNEKRYLSSGVQINSTTFWILGGSPCPFSNDGYLDSTEFIIQDQTKGILGPKLPYGMDQACAVKLSEEEIFVIGGWDGSDERDEVWIYNPQNGFARKRGPYLNTRRFGHSCSTMRDGEKTFILVAGGYSRNGEYFDSVEIYDPTDKNWYSGNISTNSIPQFFLNHISTKEKHDLNSPLFCITGPSLPHGLEYSAMAESPDGRAVLLFGGYNGDENTFEDKILELRAGAKSWNILDVTLQEGRDQHLVIPLI